MPYKRTVQSLLITMLCVLLSVNVAAQNLTEVYVNSDTDLSDFSKVILRELDINGAQIIPPVWVQGEDRNPHKWKISKKNVRLMQEAFQSVVKRELGGSGGYPVVTDESDGVLEIKVGLLSLTPYAQRGEKVITKGSGEIRIQVTLRNAMTGVLLAIYEGNQRVGDKYQENTDLSSRKDAEELFVVWGQKIRRVLDEAHTINSE
ncbi:MAG: DUF3313 family protein [bacterium]|nr:DUF3313 family protein [Gammaproteobacteria bacterium]HIL97821.1 DUF3313 family protein [Pseudomonadales bacterium]